MTTEITSYLDSYNSGGLLFRLVTCTVASPSVATRKFHGLTVGDRVQFDTDATLPTGIVSSTWYWIISTALTSDDFEFSATKSGSGVAVTVAGTGQLYFATDKPSRLAVSQESNR